MIQGTSTDSSLIQQKATLLERDERIAQLEGWLAERDERIAQLEGWLAKRDERIAQLEGRIEALMHEVRELRSQLGQNSSNSSKPPSSDSPAQREQRKKKKKKKKGKRRKAGGQPGHQGARRTLVPLEEVDEVKPVVPAQCSCCGETVQLLEGGPSPVRHQVWEIPPIAPHVTEYQLLAGWCRDCRSWTRAKLPEEVPADAFGPRLTSLVALMTGRMRLSKRLIQEFLADVLGVAVSLGSISAMERRVASVLKQPYTEARQYIQEQPCVHVDETGWYERSKRAWLWVAATKLMSVFTIARSRGGEVAKDLLGGDFVGITVSDRWSGYDWLDTDLRQLCWAHLQRAFEGWVERDAGAAKVGCALLKQVRKLFHIHHQKQWGKVSYEVYRPGMTAIQDKVRSLLQTVTRSSDTKAARTARRLLKRENALWTFLDVDGVEPTNNLAEHALRPAVCMRKMSHGTHSPVGSSFVERILTVVSSLRLQGHNVLEYLMSAIQSSLRGERIPSLLPSQPPVLPQPP
jgi:transposase